MKGQNKFKRMPLIRVKSGKDVNKHTSSRLVFSIHEQSANRLQEENDFKIEL